MDVRPVDLPELRAEVQAQFRDPAFMRCMYTERSTPSDPDLCEFGGTFACMAGTAELYYVAPPMADLAFVAAESLEAFSLQPEDVPAEIGFMIFDSDRHLHAPFADGCTGAVHGYLWTTDGAGLMVMPLLGPHGANRLARRVQLDLSMTFRVNFGADVGEFQAKRDIGVASYMLADLLSTWLLMQQPLSIDSEVDLDRATRRRLRRAGHEERPVRVIELRRTARSGSGDGSREFHHQWIVRGHWRQHWHPKRQVHRPVWIAPHIKGPEGAPLIGGEKVYAWKR